MSWSLLVFAALNFLAACSGAFFKPGAWFESLDKPAWMPPNWAFPVVWTVLFAANAYAGWLVWRELGTSPPGLFAMSVYGVALVLNAAWSWLFFGLRRLWSATVGAAMLFVAVGLQIVVFYPVEPVAGLVLLPYLAWVAVATALANSVRRRNPHADLDNAGVSA